MTSQHTSSLPSRTSTSSIIHFGIAGAFLAALTFLPGCHDSGASDEAFTSTRRHVLLVTVDTLRPDYLSTNGYDLPTSPFVDSLLTQGVTFARAITPVPRTTPALASLLTGTYPHTTKVYTLVDALAPEIVTLAELAKKRGYTTLAVVSNHILAPERGLHRGFDIYDFADDSRDAAATTAAALLHLTRYKSEEPVFAWVHYIDPHVPYYPPPELAYQFDPTYKGRYQLRFGAVRGGIGDQAYPEDLGKAQAVFQNTLPDSVNAHVRRLYAADVRYTDDHVAQLITQLRAAFGDDWLIIFTADHGESLGENNYFYDHGDYVSNAELRVPLTFVFAPGDPLREGRAIGDWVSLVDVMPTLAELLDLQLPTQLTYEIEGRSLVPYMRGNDLPPRPVFAECGKAYFPSLVQRRVKFGVEGRFRTVFLGDWKLIWTPGQREDLLFELYNVRTDPHERSNRYLPGNPHTEHLKALLRRWEEQRIDTRSAADPSAADRERLRSLGYTD